MMAPVAALLAAERRCTAAGRRHRSRRIASMAAAAPKLEFDFDEGMTRAQIREKFKTFVKLYHPDVTGDQSRESVAEFLAILEQYKKIMAGEVQSTTMQVHDNTEELAADADSIWELLGMEAGAPRKEIRREFKVFVRKNHPDVSGDHSLRNMRRWNAITESYRQIMQISDDLFWVKSWCARVENYELRKLQNAQRIRRERVEAREAREAAKEAERLKQQSEEVSGAGGSSGGWLGAWF